MHPRHYPVVIVALVAAIYLPTIHYPFLYDSKLYLVQSPFVRDFPLLEMLRDVPAFVAKYTQLVRYPDYVVNFVLRPFCYLTFHLNYLAGGFAPEGYRLVNMGIHALTAILLYLLVKRLLDHRETGFSPSRSARIAFLGAVLFAVSPLASESVLYVVQRFTAMASCLYLAALYGHLRSLDAGTAATRKGWRAASTIVLVLGMLTKEIVVTAPVMMVALSLMVRRQTLIQSVKGALPQLCCLPLIPVLLILAEQGDGTRGAGIDDLYNAVNFNDLGAMNYVLTQTRAILSYLRMILVPYGQSFYHTYPLATSPGDPQLLFSIAVIALFMVAAWRLAIRRLDPLCHLVAYFIVWFLVTFSVTWIVPLPELFNERHAYLPSAGLIFGLLIHAVRLGQGLPPRMLTAAAVILVIAYGAITMDRSRVWSSKLALWRDVVQKYPCNPMALNDLGDQYLQRNDFAAAIPLFERALAVEKNACSYQNLGAALLNSGRYEEALAVYMDGLYQSPNDHLLCAGAGAALFYSGTPEQAVPYLEQAIQLKPDFELAKELFHDARSACASD